LKFEGEEHGEYGDGLQLGSDAFRVGLDRSDKLLAPYAHQERVAARRGNSGDLFKESCLCLQCRGLTIFLPCSQSTPTIHSSVVLPHRAAGFLQTPETNATSG
jgi:hypothetical protein